MGRAVAAWEYSKAELILLYLIPAADDGRDSLVCGERDCFEEKRDRNGCVVGLLIREL